MSDPGAAQPTPQDQEGVAAFLAGTTLFLGPDPEIMNDHRMAPRTADGVRDDGADRCRPRREVG